jgi:hypothetical protein
MIKGEKEISISLINIIGTWRIRSSNSREIRPKKKHSKKSRKSLERTRLSVKVYYQMI